MNKLNLKLLLILILFLFACAGSDKISEIKKPLESSGDEKQSTGRQSGDNRQPSTLINFNPDGYDSNCITENLGPQKAYEVYEFNKIDLELMNQIGGCELSEDEKKSMGRQDGGDKNFLQGQAGADTKYSQTSTLIDFDPDGYDRNCITDGLGSEKTDEIYKSNKFHSEFMYEIENCKTSRNDPSETIKQLIERLYLPKTLVISKILESEISHVQ